METQVQIWPQKFPEGTGEQRGSAQTENTLKKCTATRLSLRLWRPFSYENWNLSVCFLQQACVMLTHPHGAESDLRINTSALLENSVARRNNRPHCLSLTVNVCK